MRTLLPGVFITTGGLAIRVLFTIEFAACADSERARSDASGASIDGSQLVIDARDGEDVDTRVAADAPLPDAITYAANIVFHTSTTHAPSLGGLAAADQICAERATAASLPGTYVAYVSTSTTHAIDRLSSARGWVRVDGRPFVDRPQDIAEQKILYPPRLDEFGNERFHGLVMTGTDWGGRYDESRGNCSDFTSTAGTLAVGSTSATTLFANEFVFTHGCETEYHLYCFGVDKNVPLAPQPASGRIAFVSNFGMFMHTGGTDEADLLCESEASDAGLSGSFRAFIASSSFSAVSRFDTTGPPWIRPDGVPIVARAADLGAGSPPTGINQRADGTYQTGVMGYWTGAPLPTEAAWLSRSCQDWTSMDRADRGMFGVANDTAPQRWFGLSTELRQCGSFLWAVLCLEQ